MPRACVSCWHWQREGAGAWRAPGRLCATTLAPQEVFVFTPNWPRDQPAGKVIVCSRDFAYAVHTEAGHRCIGAGVNGNLGLPGTAKASRTATWWRSSTSPSLTAGPSRDWLDFVQVAAGPLQDPPVVHQGTARGGHRAGQGPDCQVDAQGGPADQAAAHPRGRWSLVAAHLNLAGRDRRLRRRRRGQPRCPDRRAQG